MRNVPGVIHYLYEMSVGRSEKGMWQKEHETIQEFNLSTLVYADDLELVAESEDDLRIIIECLDLHKGKCVPWFTPTHFYQGIGVLLGSKVIFFLEAIFF